MKDYIESYHMFFPDKKFRFLLYLVYPLAVWALLYIESIFFDGSFILVFTAAEIIIAVECLADFFIFAGYARKVSGRNAYTYTMHPTPTEHLSFNLPILGQGIKPFLEG